MRSSSNQFQSMYLTKRQELSLTAAALIRQRTSFIPVWREIAEHTRPSKARFVTTEVNKGTRRNEKIIDSTACEASHILQAGMVSGITSQAKPWFELATVNPDLMSSESVQQWLYVVAERMRAVYLRSNLYHGLPILYGSLGDFGTGALFCEEDTQQDLRFYTFPVGSFCISNNERMQVDTFYREYTYTVRQIVKKFGVIKGTRDIDWSRISLTVRNLWERGNYEEQVILEHMVWPNEYHDPRMDHPKFKAYGSCTWEKNGDSQSANGEVYPDGLFLKESGYDLFPVLCPRWDISDGDAYGTDCPGMQALGDNKALQLLQKDMAQIVQKLARPPMVAPPYMKKSKLSILPGDTTYVQETNDSKFRPAIEMQGDLQKIMILAKSHQDRIDAAYKKNIFMATIDSDRRQVTATEIDTRNAEKLVVMGPVLERLNQDLLDPLIDWSFSVLLRRGRLPVPPNELHGQPLQVKYTSIMAQAQKLAGVESLFRFATHALSIAAQTGNPALVTDSWNVDEHLSYVGEGLSLPPGVVRGPQSIAAIRQGRQRAAQIQQQTEGIQTGAQAVKALSDAKPDENSALTKMAQTIGNARSMQQQGGRPASGQY